MTVVRLAEDPGASARDITQAVVTDLALSSRALRIANSAYYGLSRQVSTVGEAVLILGARALRDLAIAAASAPILHLDTSGYGMARGALWKHSIGVAVTAQTLAKRVRGVRQAEAFTAGLLHDVGKVVLHQHVAAQMQAILAFAELDSLSFVEAEKFVLGFDHAETGAHVAEKWNLPSELCQAIGGHHHGEGASSDAKLAAVVHIANALSAAEGLQAAIAGQEAGPDEEAVEALGLTTDALEAVQSEVLACLDKGADAFRLMAA